MFPWTKTKLESLYMVHSVSTNKLINIKVKRRSALALKRPFLSQNGLEIQ